MGAVKERPYQYTFSKNEIRYKFELQSVYSSDLRLEVKLYVEDIETGTPELIEEFPPLTPDASRNVTLWIQDYLDSVLTYVMPEPGQVFTNANDQCRKFYIHFRETTTAIPDPAWITTEEASKRIVLKGGVEKQKNSRNNFFINYFEPTLPFLTWQPEERFVAEDQKMYLTIFNPAIATAGYMVKVDLTQTDGTVIPGSNPISNVPANCALMHVAADLTTHGLNGTPDLWYYQIAVVDGAASPVGSSYKFLLEFYPVYEVYDIVYHNSLGGLDFARILGEVQLEMMLNADEAEGGFSTTDYTDTTKNAEAIEAAITGRRAFKGDVGFLNTKKEQEALQEILFSRSRYEMIDGRWIPLCALQKSHTLRRTSDKKFSFPLEWKHSIENEVFTPNHISFGVGTDTEVY
jgi:hypothetical protein